MYWENTHSVVIWSTTRSSVLRAIVQDGEYSDSMEVTILHEATNPVDPDSVAIFTTLPHSLVGGIKHGCGSIIGYVRRSDPRRNELREKLQKVGPLYGALRWESSEDDYHLDVCRHPEDRDPDELPF